MRRAGDVCFSQVFRDRDGMLYLLHFLFYYLHYWVVEFLCDPTITNEADLFSL